MQSCPVMVLVEIEERRELLSGKLRQMLPIEHRPEPSRDAVAWLDDLAPQRGCVHFHTGLAQAADCGGKSGSRGVVRFRFVRLRRLVHRINASGVLASYFGSWWNYWRIAGCLQSIAPSVEALDTFRQSSTISGVQEPSV
jgi:hypothetical protein